MQHLLFASDTAAGVAAPKALIWPSPVPTACFFKIDPTGRIVNHFLGIVSH
jgi:hypothetical protein